MSRLLTRPVLVGIAVVALIAGAGAYFVFAAPTEPIAAAATPSPTASPSPTPRPTPRPTRRPTPSPSPTATPSPSPTPAAARCPLNGAPLADPANADRVALIVQVENHPDARPATNLNLADLVMEAPVEGDTTRFSGIYLCNDTELLTGPVRSARYYNVDLWQEVHGLTVGFGASDGALAMFGNAGMPYVNGLHGGWPWFYRAGSYVAPHNLYADVEALRGALGRTPALDAIAAGVGQLRPPFAIDPNVVLPAGRAVNEVTMQTATYWSFGWSWNPRLAVWTRSDAGRAVHDAASGDPLMARTVIVQRVTQEVVYGDPDPGGFPRRLQHFVGEGTGTAYINGAAFDLRWSRPSVDAATTWTHAASGEPLVLPEGRIWWEVLPTTAGLGEG